ncbi:MAG: hypothetical protein R2764_24190 [Bacteroidales bacterium]
MIIQEAKDNGIQYIIEGQTKDDEKGDYRPGMIALKELGVLSPLKEAELTKAGRNKGDLGEMNLPPVINLLMPAF